MKKNECTVCKSTNVKQIDYMRRYDKYVLMKCKECGLKFILSKDFEKLSDDVYWDDVNKKIYSMPMVLKEFKRKHIKYLDYLIKCGSPNNKLLDVGSGNGIFLSNAKERNFKVTGVEPSQMAVELCKSHYNIDTVCCYLDSDSDMPRDYGILSAWDVIEHVEDPKKFIEICHAHLIKGGVFLLETPDESCLIRKVVNIIDRIGRFLGLKSSSNIYYPSHRYYFTHKSMIRLLTDVGFTKIKIFHEHSIYSKSKAKYKLYRKLPTIKMLKYNFIFFILKFPLFWNKQVIICQKR